LLEESDSGAEGPAGACPAIHVGYKANGTGILWRKVATAIQYFNVTSVDGCCHRSQSCNDIYVFTNYSSLTGAWTFAGGPGGLFKFANANPTSYIQLYTTTDFFCGFPLIDKARMYLWGIAKDTTALYRSFIDVQRDGTSFTQVANENAASGNGSQTAFSGVLYSSLVSQSETADSSRSNARMEAVKYLQMTKMET
jgi:hypothetical protein